jgi:hypothetical protein
MELKQVITDVGAALKTIDRCGVAFKTFQEGVGPYGEPQLLRSVAEYLNGLSLYGASVQTKRTPDLLIPQHWALEFKIARPFGDNGKEAENWSVNLLHPYPGHASLIGDCIKLEGFGGVERKAVVVIGYEHTPPKIPLSPLFEAFELIVTRVAGVRIGDRVQINQNQLCHPVHQQFVLAAWEVLPHSEEHSQSGSASENAPQWCR